MLKICECFTEGYAAGHCPYLDQCVFTHMDAQDVLAWLKVEEPKNWSKFPIVYSSGRLQQALSDQQSPLYTGNAHKLVPGGKSGEDTFRFIHSLNITDRHDWFLSTHSFWNQILIVERCSEWVFGLVGGEGRRFLCHWNPGRQTFSV